MTNHSDIQGCERCQRLRAERDDEVGLERILDDLPFDRPRVEGASVAYDSSWLSRCQDCGTCWLSQFWEVFDDILQENGSRQWISYPVGAAAVEEITSAVKHGTRLAHNQFH